MMTTPSRTRTPANDHGRDTRRPFEPEVLADGSNL